MRIRVHRGTKEIGGSCVEVEAQGKRLVLDLGRPLGAAHDDDVPLPPIPGLQNGANPSLLGILITHPHQDHWGLVPQAAPTVPVWMGEAATRILREAAFFSRGGADLRPTGYLKDRQQLQLGPFTVTPFLVDHSAFDAYALLVEADGERLFYTGDFRAHGRKSKLFERLVHHPPEHIDVLLMEGTMIQPEETPPREEGTEQDVERRCVERFKATPGLALVVFSAQNIDRLVTLYRAALQADRDFVMDLYTATLARATGNENIPQPGPKWPRVRVFVPRSQRVRVKEAGEFERVDWVRRSRIYPEQLAAIRSRLVMTFRTSMARELEWAQCLEGASVTWSLWGGYLADDTAMKRFSERNGVAIAHEHSSGHALVADLQELAERLAPGRLVPIHSSAPELFGKHFAHVEVHGDGEWWALSHRREPAPTGYLGGPVAGGSESNAESSGEPATVRLARLFAINRLGRPFVPEELAASLVEHGAWQFATRPLPWSPYAMDQYVEEAVTRAPRDYLVVAHAGQGSNSYAVCYFLVRRSLALFLQVGWGGVYMNAEESAANVASALEAVASLAKAADLSERATRRIEHKPLLVVASDFHASWWAPPDQPWDRQGGDFELLPPGAQEDGGGGFVALMKTIEAANRWLTR